jgi:hypothetical protein
MIPFTMQAKGLIFILAKGDQTKNRHRELIRMAVKFVFRELVSSLFKGFNDLPRYALWPFRFVRSMSSDQKL